MNSDTKPVFEGAKILSRDKTRLSHSGERWPGIDLSGLRMQMYTAMFRFLKIELGVGLTFARAAQHALWTSDLLHNRRLARKAYDAVVRRIEKVRFSKDEAKEIASRLQQLRLALLQLGDPPDGRAT